MNQNKISVIIANYNHSDFIEKRIESFINQTFKPYEIIIVDDGSTDDSRLILEKLSSKFSELKVIYNLKNKGAVYSYNKGLKCAEGDYFFPCAMDDIAFPQFFEEAIESLEKNKNAAFCYTLPSFSINNKISESQNKKVLKLFGNKKKYFTPDDFVKISRNAIINIDGHSCLFRKNLFIECNYYDESLNWYCDFFLIYFAVFKYGFCFIPEKFTALNVFQNSYSSNKKKDNESLTLENLLKKIQNQEKFIIHHFMKSNILANFGSNLYKIIKVKPDNIFNTFELRKRVFYISIKNLFKKTVNILS